MSRRNHIVLDTGLSKIRMVEFAVSITMMVFGQIRAEMMVEYDVIVRQKNAL